MYSLNVPVSGEVARVAAGLVTACRTADVRTRHTLVVKRLGDERYGSLAPRVRRAVEGTPPFAARIARIEAFEQPASGDGPLAYLAVESPGMVALHERLCETFDPVGGIEGEAYVPHVTLARGGDADRLVETSIEPVTWTVDRLVLWDGIHHEPAESIALPA